MTADNVFVKDPGATLDDAFDFKALTNGTEGATEDWLASGETISSQTVIATTGLTVISSAQSGGKVTAWVTGGTAGRFYDLICTIVTSTGRTDVRRIRIKVSER